MKRAAVITILILCIMSSSCADKAGYTADSAPSVSGTQLQDNTQSKNQPQLGGQSRQNGQTEETQQPQTSQLPSTAFLPTAGNEELNRLVNTFTLPTRTSDTIKKETDGQGLPVDLLNELKLAVYQETSDELLEEWNDDSLEISINDFIFKPSGSEELAYWETELENEIKDGARNSAPYKLDIDGDGEGEVIILDCKDSQDYYINRIYTLKKKQPEDVYELLSCEYLGCRRSFAVFEHEGDFYLAANFDDSKTQTTAAVGLFSLKSSRSSEPLYQNCTYVKKAYSGVDSYALYRNESEPIAAEVQAYAEEIKTDLLYVDDSSSTFYGDEAEAVGLSYDEKDSSGQRITNLYAVDADNDGLEECFTRKYNRKSGIPEVEILWYDLKRHTEVLAPYEVWTPDQYILKQKWFKKIQEKTVMFTLYWKTSGENYLLDARIIKDGGMELLLDTVLWKKEEVVLSDTWYNGDSKQLNIVYSDPDREKAVPDTIYEDMEHFGAEVQGGICSR